MIRFVHCFNYAEGVSRKEGDAWYLGEHAARARALPGLVGYVSYPQVPVGLPLPNPHDRFVRRSELHFRDLDAALSAVHGNLDLWAPSEPGMPGFREFECMFMNENPEYDLLRDAPPEHYKYMTLPMWWPHGQPVIDEYEEIFIHTYVFSYREDIGTADAEDYYLGHHTREGKQLPGMQHYQTWKSIPVPEVEGTAIQPNKYFRLTELGMSPASYTAVMIDDDSRIRFTTSPFGRVMGHYYNISIKFHIVDNLMI